MSKKKDLEIELADLEVALEGANDDAEHYRDLYQESDRRHMNTLTSLDASRGLVHELQAQLQTQSDELYQADCRVEELEALLAQVRNELSVLAEDTKALENAHADLVTEYEMVQARNDDLEVQRNLDVLHHDSDLEAAFDDGVRHLRAATRAWLVESIAVIDEIEGGDGNESDSIGVEVRVEGPTDTSYATRFARLVDALMGETV